MEAHQRLGFSLAITLCVTGVLKSKFKTWFKNKASFCLLDALFGHWVHGFLTIWEKRKLKAAGVRLHPVAYFWQVQALLKQKQECEGNISEVSGGVLVITWAVCFQAQLKFGVQLEAAVVLTTEIEILGSLKEELSPRPFETVFRFGKKHLSWIPSMLVCSIQWGKAREGELSDYAWREHSADTGLWLLQVYANFSTPPSSQGNAPDHSVRINSVGSSASSTQPLLVREDVWVTSGRRGAQMYWLFVLCRGWERDDFNNFSYFYSLLPLCSWNVVVLLSFTTHCYI